MSKRVRVLITAASSVLVLYIVVGGLMGESKSTSEQTYRDLGVYSEVLSRIKSDYVTEPDLAKVTGGAIRGLLEALDPYSTYFTPAEYKDYLAHPDPGPASVGLYVSKKFGFATVVSVLPGSPADKAGIKANYLVDRVAGISAREISVVQIDRMLAGQPNTQVDVTIVDEDRGEPKKITLTREVLSNTPVVSKMFDATNGYIRVATFSPGTADQVSQKVKELTGQGAAKIVLDLRNCAGGRVDEAVKTASLFIQKGLIAYTYGQRSPRQDINANPAGTVFNMPVAVLINRSTAGPAEIVADAILCDKRGQVVGVPSFGEGVVQKDIPVGDGSGLLLSVAKYYGPDGRAIEDNGVTPSVMAMEQAPGGDQTGAPPQTPQFGEKGDSQLEKAIEVLKNPPAAAKAA
jgi:carboxyl-terminal processing protease